MIEYRGPLSVWEFLSVDEPAMLPVKYVVGLSLKNTTGESSQSIRSSCFKVPKKDRFGCTKKSSFVLAGLTRLQLNTEPHSNSHAPTKHPYYLLQCYWKGRMVCLAQRIGLYCSTLISLSLPLPLSPPAHPASLLSPLPLALHFDLRQGSVLCAVSVVG